MCLLLKGKRIVFTHVHWNYSSAGSLARLITLGMNGEVFELSQKKSF